LTLLHLFGRRNTKLHHCKNIFQYFFLQTIHTMKFILQLAFVTVTALAAGTSAADVRTSIATPDVGGAEHRGGGMNARDRQRRRIEVAEEKRRLRLESIKNGN
jgi:hypothetical protein